MKFNITYICYIFFNIIPTNINKFNTSLEHKLGTCITKAQVQGLLSHPYLSASPSTSESPVKNVQ